MSDHGSNGLAAPGTVAYSEPHFPALATLIAVLYLAQVARNIAGKLLYAGLLGEIAIGVIFGPVAKLLPNNWETTFLVVGYIGLVLIIFEGGLTTEPSTTFFVLRAAGPELGQSIVGEVLKAAALVDDVVALVLLSVLHPLAASEGSITNLGWLVGRPIVASAAMAIVTPVLAVYVFRPIFRTKRVTSLVEKGGHEAEFFIGVAVLCAFLAIAFYAGTTMLLGAFLAGYFLGALPHPSSRVSFIACWDDYILQIQEHLLVPLFFVSIGYSIPFLDLWTGARIWHGVVYAVLMAIGKLIAGAPIIFIGLFKGRKARSPQPEQSEPSKSRSREIERSDTGSATIQVSDSGQGQQEKEKGIPRRQSDDGAEASPETERAESERPSEGNAEDGSDQGGNADGARSVDDAEKGVSKQKGDGAKKGSGSRAYFLHETLPAAGFIGLALVARGEIGVLVLQVARTASAESSDPILREPPYLTGLWAVALCTIAGPISFGLLTKRYGERIKEGEWGIPKGEDDGRGLD
ncbi:hypothetical protein JCM8202v2_001487 [Rhodotorula sphaerocarpa]